MQQVYQVGGSLPIDSPIYVRRQADQDLYEFLKQGKFCYVLTPRQTGKSSLRVRITEQLRTDGIICAPIDLTAIGTAAITAEEWYAGIIDCIVNALGIYDQFDLEVWWEQNRLLSPAQRLGKFFDWVLMKLIAEPIVILIDEIDSTLSLPFSSDDFFALIRECYNRRADTPDYRRLSFALFGVTTPSDLIADPRRTPFNIGKSIQLTGMSLAEAAPLGIGVEHLAVSPQTILAAVLEWTGGQPFLTQRVLKLITQNEQAISADRVKEDVAALVQRNVIENWLQQDTPEHLKTIQDRLLNGPHRDRLLALYSKLLQSGGIPVDGAPEQITLRLSGLVTEQNGILQVANQIYAKVFTPLWIEQHASSDRNSSQFQDAVRQSNFVHLPQKLSANNDLAITDQLKQAKQLLRLSIVLFVLSGLMLTGAIVLVSQRSNPPQLQSPEQSR